MYAIELIDLNLLRVLLLTLRAARASHERAELRCHEPSEAGARGLTRLVPYEGSRLGSLGSQS